jgi:hypothetical protein
MKKARLARNPSWPREEDSFEYFTISTAENWPPERIERSELTADDVVITVRYGPPLPERPEPKPAPAQSPAADGDQQNA